MIFYDTRLFPWLFPFSQGKTGKTAGLLLQTLTTNGTLPVTLSAVETWAPGRTGPLGARFNGPGFSP